MGLTLTRAIGDVIFVEHGGEILTIEVIRYSGTQVRLKFTGPTFAIRRDNLKKQKTPHVVGK